MKFGVRDQPFFKEN